MRQKENIIASWALLACLAACARGPAPRAPRDGALEPCGTRHAWRARTPAPDATWIYGAGNAATDNDALVAARAEAAATLAVTIRVATSERAFEWSDKGRKSGEESVAAITQSLVAARLDECTPIDACVSELGVHRLLRCARQSGLDRALSSHAAALSRVLAERAPPASVLLVLPATDSAGFVSALGEYTAAIVRDALDRALPAQKSLRLLRTAPWQPIALREVARSYSATHVLRSEYVSVAGEAAHLSSWLVALADEQPIAGASAASDIPLDAAHAALNDVRGPLFPMKDALDLSAVSGSAPRVFALSERQVDEGALVRVDFELSARGYVYLFDVYEDGRAALLMPNALVPDNAFEGNVRVVLPNEAWRAKNLTLRACPFPGRALTRESIKLVSSRTPLDLHLERFSGPDFYTLEGGPQGRLGEVVARLNQLKRQGVELETASASYEVRATGKSSCPR